MARNAGDVTPVGTIVSETPVEFTERFAKSQRYFPLVERVIKTPEGAVRDPQVLWDRGNFAGVVATDTDNKFVLVEERKNGQMILMTSAPTGGVKKGETPLDAAMREFLAETGYVSGSWIQMPLSKAVDFPDKTDGGRHTFFRVTNARKQQEPRDPGQKVVLATREELIGTLIPSGIIPAMSIAALLYAIVTE